MLNSFRTRSTRGKSEQVRLVMGAANPNIRVRHIFLLGVLGLAGCVPVRNAPSFRGVSVGNVLIFTHFHAAVIICNSELMRVCCEILELLLLWPPISDGRSDLLFPLGYGHTTGEQGVEMGRKLVSAQNASAYGERR